MKKIFLFASLLFIISCSKDEDEARLIRDTRTSIQTWKLISVKNNIGIEIANDCELQNGQIVEKYDPKNTDPFEQHTAILTEGKIKSSECQIVTTTNVLWYVFGDRIKIPNGVGFYNYNYLMEYESGTTYMSLTLTSYEDGGSLQLLESKTLKYRLVNKEYLD